jgi:sec-independent protein translocase protein TatB
MLGLDWTELALIAVVAVVIIGPKDLPDAVRGIAKGLQKLRRMAGEFQGQVDEVVREAKLDDVRNQINEIRSFNVRDMVEKEIDKDGSIRKTFTEDPIGNPLRDAFAPSADMPPPLHGAEVTPPPAEAAPAAGPPAPAFIPPAFIPPGAIPPPAPVLASQPTPPPAPVSAPAFVPPSGTSAS